MYSSLVLLIIHFHYRAPPEDFSCQLVRVALKFCLVLSQTENPIAAVVISATVFTLNIVVIG